MFLFCSNRAHYKCQHDHDDDDDNIISTSDFFHGKCGIRRPENEISRFYGFIHNKAMTCTCIVD